MIRDGLHTGTTGSYHNASKVGMYHLTVNFTTHNNNDTLAPSTGELNNTSASVPIGSEEWYRQQQKQFYDSYDPSVGYNTAAVLGGMLVLLVMYVFYRTKVRKHLISLFRYIKGQYKLKHQADYGAPDTTEQMTYSFGNAPPTSDGNDNNPDGYNAAQSEVKPKGSSIPVQFLSFDSGTLSEHANTIGACNREEILRRVRPTISFDRQLSEDEPKQLPVVVMDMEIATADWVQKQHQLQHQFLSPGGIILKVKSDTICPPNNDSYPSAQTVHPHIKCCSNRHCVNARRRQYSCGARSHYSLDLNKSMPFLEVSDANLRGIEPCLHGNRRKVQLKATKFPSVSSEPKTPLLIKCTKFSSLSSEPVRSGRPPDLTSQPSQDSGPRTPLIRSPQPKTPIPRSPVPQQRQPHTLVKQHTLTLPVQQYTLSLPLQKPNPPSPHLLRPPPLQQRPLQASCHRQTSSTQKHTPPQHITPIIKIQNYDKSQRRMNSVSQKESVDQDSVSSSSSEEAQIYRIPAEQWQSPKPPRRGILVRENAVTSLSACPVCDKLQSSRSPRKQVSLDTGFHQLRLPSPSPGSNSHNTPNMETPL
ncbi:uncharacterized protein LOC110462690 [Mizuhopecten yessoensis]|uniref:uncharacterized protein LOC110462690 n=1 Tax=Mizuhopecten yessoensis TaxID=6573 RepID=UPI000B45D534|nr:uncharacterized protein LOC110462690 [Mizuhopecten yessoensis]XP_021372462.1 uncharacterized protein LOC110462690 [Mizuhopecten yessoensis]XP_021372463.1 uncharacterized protein LOC110462690 [Mizuhopecten yessoensis]